MNDQSTAHLRQRARLGTLSCCQPRGDAVRPHINLASLGFGQFSFYERRLLFLPSDDKGGCDDSNVATVRFFSTYAQVASQGSGFNVIA